MYCAEQIAELNNTVWATIRPSSISGVGVFAIRDIPNNALITDYSIHHRSQAKKFNIHQDYFDLILPEIRQLILDRMIFDSADPILSFYSPNTDACLQSFINHSTSPNFYRSRTNKIILKWEEITMDVFKLPPYEMHDLSKKHHNYATT